MYYIINNTDKIIAADNALLNLLGLKSIEELTKMLILGDAHFSSHTNEVLIVRITQQEFNFDSNIFSLSSILGDLKLIHLNIQEKLTKDIKKPTETKIDDLVLKSTKSDTIGFLNESINKKQDDELFTLIIPNTPEKTIDEITLKTEDHSEPLSKEGVSLDTLDIEKKNMSTVDNTIMQDTTPIMINIDEISQNVGISTEDYTIFLNEYIDTAISLESDLQSSNIEKQTFAIATLTQLADILQLPKMNEIVTKIEMQNQEEKKQMIAYFYVTLSRLTTSTHQKSKESIVNTSKKQDIFISATQEEGIKIDLSTIPQNVNGNVHGFGTIDLSSVKPIHFNFLVEEAANDLSLPLELIQEFVYDFINQAEEETEKMLLAHEEGDLDTIQKIGHLLKGASSNLRINALSDTLYQIQFCEDSSNLDKLIKRYWGQFLAFKQQVNMSSK